MGPRRALQATSLALMACGAWSASTALGSARDGVARESAAPNSAEAPETILGEQPDCRVDIYAIGRLLRFLLTGEAVFSAQNRVQLLLHHLKDDPTPPSQSADQPIPSAVDDLVLACLQKDPARRPSNVDEVSRRATIEIPGEVWDQEAARQWWKTHLPDSSGWIDLAADPITADRLTPETGVRAQPESAWIVPVRMD